MSTERRSTGSTAPHGVLRAQQAAARVLLALACLACNTCVRRAPTPEHARPRLSVEEVTQLVPRGETDRAGWAQDVVTALEAHGLWPDLPTVCSVLAVIEQESGFEPNPAVPNLSRIVRQRLEEAAGKLGPLGAPAMRELLGRKAPGERFTFAERLDRVKTEQDLDRVFRDLLAYFRQEFPATYTAANLLGQLFQGRAFEDYNPITTAGSMQVSVQYARELAEQRGRRPEDVRDELYTRYGGVYYGTARLLDYPADYAEPIYRFADYNAGLYASRNAAVQAQLSELTGRKLTPDGDLLAYDARGEPLDRDSRTLQAFLAFRERYAPEELGERQLRRDLRKEKERGLEETDTWRILKREHEKRTGRPAPYARLPEVTISSPKMAKERSTAWFAKNVDLRYRRCLARHPGAPKG